MVWFIFAVILFILSVVGVFVGFRFKRSERQLRDQKPDPDAPVDKYSSSSYSRVDELISTARIAKLIAFGAAAVLAAIGIWFTLISTLYSNTVGEAKVIVNTVSGTLDGEKLDTGLGVKAPWQDVIDFDLFSQELAYAGGDQAPSYTGGQVSGKEVTVAVGGINGGSTQANVDVTITYSLDADQVTEIYSKNKSQERFTKQIIEKTVLATVREVPSDYNAIEFRGTKRQEAADKITKILTDKLQSRGVGDFYVNIQDIRYPEAVENALKEVEVQNQAAQAAEAKQRAAQVEAETKVIEAKGVADAAVEKARGESEANRLLNESLTPSVLQQRYIDALKEGTVFVVPEDSQPMVNTGK